MEENLFSVLGLEPSLAISVTDVDSAWRELSAINHPDADSNGTDNNEASALLNQAREVLSNPAGVLQQWLIVKGQTIERQTTISPDLMDLFSLVGESLHLADAVIDKNNQATTALAKSLLAVPAIAAQKNIQNALASVTNATNQRVAMFPAMEKQEELQQALEVLNELKFLAKWSQQCQQRLVALIAI